MTSMFGFPIIPFLTVYTILFFALGPHVRLFWAVFRVGYLHARALQYEKLLQNLNTQLFISGNPSEIARQIIYIGQRIEKLRLRERIIREQFNL